MDELPTRAIPASGSQRRGAAATVAILAAVAGYVAVFTGHPFVGLLLELVAIVAGLIGLALSASPRIGGGLISVIAVVLGLAGVGASVLGMIGVIVF